MADRENRYLFLMARERGGCFWCGRAVARHTGPDRFRPDSATCDRIVPGAEGGTYRSANIVLSCRACNEERATLPAAAFADRKGVGDKLSALLSGSYGQEHADRVRSETAHMRVERKRRAPIEPP